MRVYRNQHVQNGRHFFTPCMVFFASAGVHLEEKKVRKDFTTTFINIAAAGAVDRESGGNILKHIKHVVLLIVFLKL